MSSQSASLASPVAVVREGTDNTSVEENKAVIRRWLEARSTNDVETAVSLFADEMQGILRGAFNGYTEGFSDVQIVLHELLAEGDKVAAWFTLHATHLGTYAGVPATGKRIEWHIVDLYTMVNGRIAGIEREASSITNILRALAGEPLLASELRQGACQGSE
jgi:predicted ester cyclase